MPTRFKHPPQKTLCEAAPQIRQAMRAGNIAEAINLLLQTGEKESALLLEKFCEAQQQYERQRIGLEEWGRTQAQICQSILGAVGMLETEFRKTPSSEIRAEILQLIHKHKTEQALAMCEDFGDQYLLLQAQFYAAKNQSVRGLIESEFFEATKSKLNYALQALMGQTMESSSAPKASFLDKIRSLFN